MDAGRSHRRNRETKRGATEDEHDQICQMLQRGQGRTPGGDLAPGRPLRVTRVVEEEVA